MRLSTRGDNDYLLSSGDAQISPSLYSIAGASVGTMRDTRGGGLASERHDLSRAPRLSTLDAGLPRKERQKSAMLFCCVCSLLAPCLAAWFTQQVSSFFFFFFCCGSVSARAWNGD
jgi:hypothetical protein